MPEYFLIQDGVRFELEMRPALANCWRQRSFGPCVELCTTLLPAVRAYTEEYHTGSVEPLLCAVARQEVGAFSRLAWRTLVGEVLLYAAVDLPELQICEQTLACLMPDSDSRTLLHHAYRGARDLSFGPVVYRPEYAGYNNAQDVGRLARGLANINPKQWTTQALVSLTDLESEEDREEELAYVREWFPVLRDLYIQCEANGNVVVWELVY